MLTFRDFITGLRRLEIDRSSPVMVHARLEAFGEVHGGAETVLGALMSSFDTLVMPTFTSKTMIIPELGPLDNAITYGSGKDTNWRAEIFTPHLPCDPQMGVLAESLRSHPQAQRSSHPILSLAGMHADEILASQTLKEPLRPIQVLKENSGWVLLMGVDQTANISLHYAEWAAGRKQFVRWALTPTGVAPCPSFPGCSDGFNAISPHLAEVLRSSEVGSATILAMPLPELLDTAIASIKEYPLALLCDREDCERCNTIRAAAIEL